MTRPTVVYIAAPNDSNGNPRRGWIVGYGETYPARFVDEGYEGRQALRAVGLDPSAGDVPRIAVSASEYRDWKRARS